MSRAEQEVMAFLAREQEIANRLDAAGNDPTVVIEVLRDLPDLLDFPRFCDRLSAAYIRAHRLDDATRLNQARTVSARARGWIREHSRASLALYGALNEVGDVTAASAVIEQALAVEHTSNLLRTAADSAHKQGDFQISILWAQRARAWARITGPREELGRNTFVLGRALGERGEYVQAAEVFAEAARISGCVGSQASEAVARAERALALANTKDFPLALALARKAVTVGVDQRDVETEAEVKGVYGTILREAGLREIAREMLKDAMRLALRTHSSMLRAKLFEQFAQLEFQENNVDLARVYTHHAAIDYFFSAAPHFAQRVLDRFTEILYEDKDSLAHWLTKYLEFANGVRLRIRIPTQAVEYLDAIPNWMDTYPHLAPDYILSLTRLGRFEEAVKTAQVVQQHPIFGISPMIRSQVSHLLPGVFVHTGIADDLANALETLLQCDNQIGWHSDLIAYVRGSLAFLRGDFSEAISWLREMFGLRHPWLHALAHERLAICYYELERHYDAEVHLQKAVDIYRRDQREAQACSARAARALIRCRLGDYRMAHVLALRALKGAQRYSATHAEWYARRALGTTALASGDLAVARREFQIALSGARKAHMTLLEAEVLEEVAALEVKAGFIEAAEQALEQAVQIYTRTGSSSRAERATSRFAAVAG